MSSSRVFEPRIKRKGKVIVFGLLLFSFGCLPLYPIVTFGISGNEILLVISLILFAVGLIPSILAENNFRKAEIIRLRFEDNRVYAFGKELNSDQFDELFFSKKIEWNADGTFDQEFLLDLEFYEEKEEVLNRINAYLLSQNESSEPQGVQHEHSR